MEARDIYAQRRKALEVVTSAVERLLETRPRGPILMDALDGLREDLVRLERVTIASRDVLTGWPADADDNMPDTVHDVQVVGKTTDFAARFADADEAMEYRTRKTERLKAQGLPGFAEIVEVTP